LHGQALAQQFGNLHFCALEVAQGEKFSYGVELLVDHVPSNRLLRLHVIEA
jgi:hypothetical protein